MATQLDVQLEDIGNILAYLAEHGPQIRDQIRKKGGKVGNPRTMYALMNNLVHAGLVSIDQTDAEAPEFRISRRGLDLLLRIMWQFGKENLHTRVSFLNLSKRDRDRELLPRIFPLWQRFHDSKVDDIAEELLIGMAVWAADPHFDENRLQRNFIRGLRLHDLNLNTANEATATIIEEGFFDLENVVYTSLGKNDWGRWIKALKCAPELGKPFIEQMELKNRVDTSHVMMREAYIAALKGDQAKPLRTAI